MLRHAAVAALGLLGGCATLTESNQQQVLVQTIQDNRPLAGAGCVLVNNVGKWFVTTPGRLTIQKSAGPLRVDCRKDGAGWADESIASRANANLWGNVVLTLGVGYLVDRNTGAGFDYPATLTIEMKKTGSAGSSETPRAGSIIY
ncbi:hypothetical protein [Janthinobacterium sp.]|uniref:hypothetical protein n=1 Tax=Janthinobacterium sp. TaxID=1871054 RepID=UPI00293D79EA|nr:hypothetical protein [Janthinobacterium sp.]